MIRFDDVRGRIERDVASLLPVLEWLPNYNRSWLRPEVVAGITVSASVIPEGLAYASLANLPPETGMYAGLVSTVVYVVLGTSRHLIVGPTSASVESPCPSWESGSPRGRRTPSSSCWRPSWWRR